MNYLKEYLESLLEDKPIGDKNKELWLDYLKEKYSKNYEGLFVSFVQEDKIGINPKSKYNTPNGIYTYPMKFLLDDNKVPFRGASKPKKIKILKAVSGNVLDHNISEEEYKSSLKKLNSRISDVISKYTDNKKEVINTPEKFIEITEKSASDNSLFGKLWNLTRVLSKNPNDWSKILINLGFDWVNDKERGIIHENEPTQAVFLNPNSYKLIDEEYIDTEERYKDLNKNVINDMKDIEVLLRNKSKEDVYNILMTKHSEIQAANLINNISFIRLLLKMIYSENFKFSTDQRKDILNLYKNNIIRKIKDLGSASLIMLNPLNTEGIHSAILYFKDFFIDIFYKMFKEGYGGDIFEYVDYEFLKFYFPNLFLKLIKDGYIKEIEDALTKKDFMNIQLLYKKEIEKSTKKL